MEKPKPPAVVSKPVSIVPKSVFGLRTDVLGNIHFDNQQTVIYPVAGVLAFQDVVTKKQKFLRWVEVNLHLLQWVWTPCLNLNFEP